MGAWGDGHEVVLEIHTCTCGNARAPKLKNSESSEVNELPRVNRMRKYDAVTLLLAAAAAAVAALGTPQEDHPDE